MAQEKELDLSNGKRIGHGSFGEVYQLSDGNGAFVLKIPLKPKDAQAFEDECQKLTQIDHPNVVTYFGVVDVNSHYGKKLGIKMEFCERGSLKDVIFNPTIIYSMQDVSIWAERLFDALAFIFDKHKIIHQDIKAENIFVTADFSLKLGDFGLLKESHGTRSGTFDRGTERYRSPPEIPDPKKPKETSPKLSHKNDVYSMGLVLWELVERRVVLSEYGVGADFNYNRFCWSVWFEKLSHVQGPNCLGKMKEIVQTCTRFQRRKRPEASGLLEELKTLNQANRGANEVTPREDPNEKRLIRPIGFNGKTNREPVKDQMAEGSEIIKKYHLHSSYSVRKGLVESFVKRFNSLNLEERTKFVHNIPDLIAKALEDKRLFFHEVRSDLEKLRQKKGLTNHPLEDLVQLIIEHNQKETELDIAGKLSSILTKVELPWINISDYHGLTKDLEKLGSKLRSTRFYFRAFLSTEPIQVWLLLRDVESAMVFIRNDFQLALRKGKWMNTEKSKYRVGDDDDLYYLADQEIDFYEMLKKIQEQEQLLIFEAKIFLGQLVSLEESQKRTERISVPNIGSNLPVKNYLFQLRNPPRMDCKHDPKCSILKYSSWWIEELKEMGIPYYSCSSDRALYYLKKWFAFCRSYLKHPPIFQSKPSMFQSGQGKITIRIDSPIFIRVNKNKNVTINIIHYWIILIIMKIMK